MPSTMPTPLRAVEMIALFAVPPALIWLDVVPLRLMMPLLVLFGAFAFVLLWFDRSFDRSQLGTAGLSLKSLGPVIALFAFATVVLTGAAIVFIPERFLSFPRQAPGIYLVVMLLYPLLSVYPQEVIFRAFFFHRYGGLLRHPAAIVASSGVAFAWAHLIFENWIAITLSLAGGLIFAWTYHRTRSLVAVSIEHALYGDLLFTIGLGWYFFTGSVGSGA